MQEIYLDNSATTRAFPEVAELMTKMQEAAQAAQERIAPEAATEAEGEEVAEGEEATEGEEVAEEATEGEETAEEAEATEGEEAAEE